MARQALARVNRTTPERCILSMVDEVTLPVAGGDPYLYSWRVTFLSPVSSIGEVVFHPAKMRSKHQQ